MDNVGENLLLEHECTMKGINITCKYTAPDTSQYDHWAEKKYETLYNKIKEMKI